VTPHRRGRPPGAKNITTEATKRFLLQRYRHPLLGLFDIASTPPAELARLMVPDGGIVTREDLHLAWKVHVQATVDAADFVTPREPRALTLTPGSAPLMSLHLDIDQLTMGGGGRLDQAMQLGMPESVMESALSNPMGGEVLEAEVLEAGNSPDKSNG
jgi:hypothetical protein